MPEPFSATAPIKAIKGSETKPGVTISGDEDTGLYSPGPDQLAVTVGGSDAGKFTSTGLEIEGDINLDDGGTYTTTVQCVTPTANRTISFPDATGTVGLVAGSSGQVIYNNGGALAGISTMTFDGTSVTLAGRLINNYTSLASAPAKVFTGTWFTGGSATTTKPHFLIEPTGTTSTAWSTSGTGLGVNAASGFSGRLLDLQTNGTSRMVVQGDGKLLVGTSTATGAAPVQIASSTSLGTTGDGGGLYISNTSSKTYPTTSSFTVYPGYYQKLELSTSQTVNNITPGGFNYVYSDYRELTKSAGYTSDLDRLYFIGLYQTFTWTDQNTCGYYTALYDYFEYSGVNANGKISNYFQAGELYMNPPDGGTQTITEIDSKSIYLDPRGTSTINVTEGYGYNPLIAISDFYGVGTKTVNISNYAFFQTSYFWGARSFGNGGVNTTITNLYGLRLRPPSQSVGLTITNNWGLYQEWSSAKNWFAGSSNQFPNITTTASGANAFLDSADSNRLYLSTSSITYKRDVEDLDSTFADKILDLRPVWYRSNCESDCQDWSWYGLIAEEVSEIDPRFVHYGYQEDAYELVDVTETVQLKPKDPRRKEGIETEEVTRQVRQLKSDAQKVPNGVAYERLVVPLLDIIKRQKSQLESIEARLTALEAQ